MAWLEDLRKIKSHSYSSLLCIYPPADVTRTSISRPELRHWLQGTSHILRSLHLGCDPVWGKSNHICVCSEPHGRLVLERRDWTPDVDFFHLKPFVRVDRMSFLAPSILLQQCSASRLPLDIAQGLLSEISCPRR